MTKGCRAGGNNLLMRQLLFAVQNRILDGIDHLILHCEDLEQIGPGISDDITGIYISRLNTDTVGEKRVVHCAARAQASGNNGKYQNRDLAEGGDVGLGAGDKERVISGRSLFEGGHLPVAHTCEDDLVIEQADVVGGSAVGHVGDTDTAVSGRNIGTAHIGDSGESYSACRVQYDHGDFFAGNKGERLLVEDRTVGLAYDHGVESVSYADIRGHRRKCGSG